jgi:hypothetical protein
MNALGKALGLFVALALLGAIGFGAWHGFQIIVARFLALDPQVATVTGIACLVALAAAWWIAHSLRTAMQQSKAMALREERIAAYQFFVDYWKEKLRAPARTDLAEKLQLLDRLLALYGAAAVIRAHTALRDLEREGRAQPSDLRTRFSEALVAIRKDLGADTPSGTAQELVRLIFPAPEAVPGS